MDWPFANIVQLLILTGQRCGEIGHLRSSLVDVDRLHLLPELTKNGRAHEVPLTDYTRSLLSGRDGLLFPNAAAEPFSAFASSHRRPLKLSATSGWTLHDLRRTFATGHARLGTPIHVIEKLLNHVSGSLAGVAGIYNRYSYWAEQVAAIRLWEAHVRSPNFGINPDKNGGTKETSASKA
jgi:integrase